MDQQGAKARRFFRQYPGCCSVDGKTELGFPFCQIDSCIGRRVDNDIGVYPPDLVADRLLAGEITFIPAGQDHIGARAVQKRELTPNLPVFSGNENSHGRPG
jgi:hypothetical protein